MVILMLPVTVPGYFGHAQPLVERLGAVVDGKHVEDQVLAVLRFFVDERADEAGADAVALMAGADSMRARQISPGRYSTSSMPMSAPPAVMICQRAGLKARVWKPRWTCSSQP